MQYLYHSQASASLLVLEGDEYRYIVKARRHKKGDIIHLRNHQNHILYSYLITEITRREAFLSLDSEYELIVNASKKLHIGWCVIDPKSIEKVLPALNEMGLGGVTFIYCNRSQKSFKLDFKRMEKILINSSQQSGRSSMMKLDECHSLEDFLQKYPDSMMLNFSQCKISNDSGIETIVIGCEGGFDDDEISMFKEDKIVGLDTPMILKSESAAMAITSKTVL